MLLTLLLLLQQSPQPLPGIRLPPGFSITEYAGPEAVENIYTIAFSPSGQLFASGPGYIRKLEGNDKATSVSTLTTFPKDGAQGLLPEVLQIYFVGEGGLHRMAHDGSNKKQLLKIKTGDEHATHAVKRGPDGKLYLLAGNMAGVDATFATHPNSPIKKPIAGALLRLTEEGDKVTTEILADGFRNAYDFDWNSHGQLFTYDSDNERCLGLPWFEPTRLYQILPGKSYGWQSPQRQQFWRKPPYFPDVIAPLTYLERGSPTGILCYRHTQFPTEFRDNVFCCDWTFGRIHRVWWDSSSGKPELKKTLFLEATGNHSLAISSIALHPQTGDLYFSTGGRQTRGAIYRVRHEAGFRKHELKPLHPKDTSEVATLPTMVFEDAKELASLTDFYSHSIGDTNFPGKFLEGYTTRVRLNNTSNLAATTDRLRSTVRPNQLLLQREISRAYALLESSSGVHFNWILSRITPDSLVTEDVHHLFCLPCLTSGPTRENVASWANAWLNLDKKAAKESLHRERNWNLRLSEAWKASVARCPDLAQLLVASPQFGRPEHLLFVDAFAKPRIEAATKFAAALKQSADFPMSSKLAELLLELPKPEALAIFRDHWKDPLSRDALLPSLCKLAEKEDRDLLLTGLQSLNPSSVETTVLSLNRLHPQYTEIPIPELKALASAYHQSPSDAKKLRDLLLKRIAAVAGEKPENANPFLLSLLETRYPQIKHQSLAEFDRELWNNRQKKLDWSQGNSEQGEKVYKQLCASCHNGTTSIGPDLAGVGKRFTRDDLLSTILEPSKDISARYRTTLLETTNGKFHTGIIIYEAVDGIILQTGPASTIRIPGNEVTSKRTHNKSLMPANLLDALKDQEIVDLVKHLQSK